MHLFNRLFRKWDINLWKNGTFWKNSILFIISKNFILVKSEREKVVEVDSKASSTRAPTERRAATHVVLAWHGAGEWRVGQQDRTNVATPLRRDERNQPLTSCQRCWESSLKCKAIERQEMRERERERSKWWVGEID
jgi:hypothetical protein